MWFDSSKGCAALTNPITEGGSGRQADAASVPGSPRIAVDECHAISIAFTHYGKRLIQNDDDTDADMLLVPCLHAGNRPAVPSVPADPDTLDAPAGSHDGADGGSDTPPLFFRLSPFPIPDTDPFILGRICDEYASLRGHHILEQAESLLTRLGGDDGYDNPYFITDEMLAAYSGKNNDSDGSAPIQLEKFISENIDRFSISVSAYMGSLRRLYLDTVSFAAANALVNGGDDVFAHCLEILDDEGFDVLPRQMKATDTAPDWNTTDQAELLTASLMNGMPPVPMSMAFSVRDQRFVFDRRPASIFDEARFELYQLASNGTVSPSLWSGRVSPGFCESCGRLYFRNSPRQKYCERGACQLERTRKKAREYNRRKRNLHGSGSSER